MSSATLSSAAAAYLTERERELADIPHEERAGLLEEVEASLLEAGEEPVASLGTPARFAAELRTSAGLPNSGAIVFNAFPIRYYEPGTPRDAHPSAVPDDLNPSPLR
jgi:hypothetical protein